MSEHTELSQPTKSLESLQTDGNLHDTPETWIHEKDAKCTSSTGSIDEGKTESTPTIQTAVESTASKKPQHDANKALLRDASPLLSASEITDIAVRLFNEKFVLISPEEYTQFLAAQDPDSTAIRECYMGLFDWDASLVKATRKLCLKLYLKGESQEIDRLLSAFTKSYLKLHPVNVFCTQDFEQIYIVLYSLILLNTSLHNSEVGKKSKLSQADYIRNTLTTFLLQNKKASRALSVKQKIQIECELNTYYEDLSKRELYLKKGERPEKPMADASTNRYSVAETILSSVSSNHSEHAYETATSSAFANGAVEMVNLSRQPSNVSTWSVDFDGKQRPSLAMKRISSAISTGSSSSTVMTNTHVNGHSPGNASRFGFSRALLSENANNKSVHSLRNYKSREKLRHSSRVSISTKDTGLTHKYSPDDAFSMISFGDMPHLNLGHEPEPDQCKVEDFDIAGFQDPLDLKLELQGAPYLKEGLLKLKILNNDMADLASPGEVNTSPESLALSIIAAKSGFFSFFLRDKGKDTATAATLGTSNNPVFSHKFTEYFVVVSKGELRLYSFDPKVVKKQQDKLKKVERKHAFYEFDKAAGEEDDDVGDGNWLNNAAHIGNYNLCSTYAQLERSIPGHQTSSTSSQKVIFSLSFPRVSKRLPKKFLFEAGTTEVANEFINTCNFWASKLTAVPTLEESMSSIEYGWTNLDALILIGEAFKKTKLISKWEALPKGVYLSNLSSLESNIGSSYANHEGMLRQFAQTLKYYNNLKTLFNDFNRQKYHFMKQFRKYSNTSNYKLVMSNYENRAQEYKAEFSKYKTYITMLGYGLKMRFDLEQQEQMIDWAEEILGLPEMETPEAIAIEIAKRREEAAEYESEVTKAVKAELERLMDSPALMKKLIDDKIHPGMPGSSGSQQSMNNSVNRSEENTTNPSLVKSPKAFSLAHFEYPPNSPVSQLLSADRSTFSSENGEQQNLNLKEMTKSFSTNTIEEEDETEEAESMSKTKQ
ncbi:hypothetical protein METBIDRAFT_32567 [Metschnikowia bicuspidata var. bicuspidata NRRL YB-4993]|uniref:SEC7 domain-containing protein n=1 Tax=Metschnikowia bicuspidata var. bicuspidata NRRL YB-4993 TaxID=869754 RepID=A0A1A0H8Y9_9ASCO|nr:hypothetical protein METBIDRAFT_32567 [Metschnikowia bicuspidata var. bicuspidata NRRL YB-4993]OBA20589.1 hypothetical protein METBIDRAFT_32567 [Metschnikowia bicuspidata var. bicuspidata NRRL YB-4993]